ncbi:hypothetical protein [Salinibacter ruber]|uniref:hypothetical protein n=1 Tax=Salinibacter ruber TaxID=146919 RepID=UPI002450D297|nr:hypothetical protein [Salinibacter ruber]
MSQWVLKLIKRHPTPDEVVEAGVETVAEIPYVAEERAREVIDNSRSSVAGQTDPDTGLALSMVAEDLLRLEKRIDRLKDRLWDRKKTKRPLLSRGASTGSASEGLPCSTSKLQTSTGSTLSRSWWPAPARILKSSRAVIESLRKGSARKETDTSALFCMRA